MRPLILQFHLDAKRDGLTPGQGQATATRKGRSRLCHLRWELSGWQNMLRQNARCVECGRKGVTLQHPHGKAPTAAGRRSPIDQMAPVPQLEWDEIAEPIKSKTKNPGIAAGVLHS
jgi:hypothetical protein